MTSGGKVRWGILGVAKINNRLLPGFAKMSSGQLVGIASRSLTKAQAAAKDAGIPKAYGAYEDLLADPDIDAIYNPLPNHLHEEWTRKAADAGKHVLCEKPLTPVAGSAQALVDYCQAKKIKLMDGFMWPHHPRTRELRTLLDSGKLGEVRHVEGSFTFSLPPDPSNIRLQSGMGGGSLLDVGCYPIYGMRWAFGVEPVRVFATASYQFEVDVAMTGIVWFPGNRTATFNCGFNLPLRQLFEIAGSEGVLRVPQMWVPDATAAYSVQLGELEPTVHHSPCPSQIVCMLENFNRAVLEDREPTPPATEAVKTLRVLDALARSAREGRAIDL